MVALEAEGYVVSGAVKFPVKRKTAPWVLSNRPGHSIPEDSLRPADLLVVARQGVLSGQGLGFLPQLKE